MTIHIKSIAKNICKKIKKDRDIRLAVVGNTAHGKTYFLEDIFSFIPTQPFGTAKIEAVPPFGTIVDFEAALFPTATSSVIGKTIRYTCRHADHYCARIRKEDNAVYNFHFLDIPGEIINQETFANCKRLYDQLRATKKGFIQENTWISKTDKVTTIKTVSIKENDSDQITAFDETNNTYAQNISKRRSTDYALKEDVFSYLNEKYILQDKTKQISGEDFIDGFYDYDPDSAYQVLCDYYENIRRSMTVSTKSDYEDNVAKNFYFYLFLFQSTDIVFIERFINQGNESTLLDSAACLAELTDKNFYLGIKGADTFFDNVKIKNYYQVLNTHVTDKRYIHNIIYSEAAIEIGNFIGGLTAVNTPLEQIAPFKLKENVPAVTAPLVNITSTDKRNIEITINKFCRITNDEKQFNIPRHTYFIATPITFDYVIDRFDASGIHGDSSRPNNRCYFGSLQLIEDIMKARDKKLPDGYEATGEFLNFIRGTDKN